MAGGFADIAVGAAGNYRLAGAVDSIPLVELAAALLASR